MGRTAYIGLGSNLGDSRETLLRALDVLDQEPGIRVMKASSLFVTAPVGGVDQPDFANQVALLDTQHTPEELLEQLLDVESRFGRRRDVHWGPRTLDLDLLFFEDETRSTRRLTLPHPEIPRRGFVLAPLMEIAPQLLHPTLNVTVRDLYRRWSRAIGTPQSQISRVAPLCPLGREEAF